MRRLHVFPEVRAFGRRLAAASGIPAAPIALHVFPDGESGVRVGLPAGSHAIVLRSLHHPNAKLVETLLAADALRRAGARKVTLVTPYMPYMRQDRVFVPGEAVSQRVVGRLLGDAFDGVVTVEAHLHRVRRLSEVVSGRARSIGAAPVIADWLRRGGARPLLIGPDRESDSWVRAIARASGLPYRVAAKHRLSDTRVRVELPSLPRARRAVIVDDIASSGTTLAATARALRRAGVPRIDAAVVHAVFAPGARARIRRAGVRRVVSTDSIPHESNAIALAPLLARALGRRRAA